MPDRRLGLELGLGLRPAALLAVLLLAVPAPRAAEPVRYALVIGNGAYASLPALPACRGAAASLAETLRAQGYDVTERADTGRGTLDAQLAQFARRLQDAANETALVYFCGYAAEFEGRVFLLPVSAALERDGDALTQGVLARTASEAAARGTPRGGAVLLDLVPRPGGARLDAAALQPVQERAASASLAFLAVTGQPGTAPATPLAAALRAELLPGAGGLPASVLAALRQRLGGRPDVAILAATASPPPAVAEPTPQAAAQAAAAAPAATPTAPPVAAPQAGPQAVPVPAPAPSPPPAHVMPNAAAPPAPPAANDAALVQETRMPDADRRRIQAALATGGFYSGRLDGIFGPEVRVAIRRYQAQLGAEATGRLTEGQARRLLEGAR